MVLQKILSQGKFVLFLFLIVSLPSFSLGQSAMPSFETLENNFVKETLNPIQLKAFHQRAKQKLQDFAGLIAIISDVQYDLSLRKASIPMTLRLFESDTNLIKYYDFGSKQVETRNIKTYLQSLLESKMKIQFDFTILLDEKVKELSQEHSWSIEYLQTQKVAMGNYPNLKAKINIVLRRKEKKFGKQSKYIWEVLLGDMQALSLLHP